MTKHNSNWNSYIARLAAKTEIRAEFLDKEEAARIIQKTMPKTKG